MTSPWNQILSNLHRPSGRQTGYPRTFKAGGHHRGVADRPRVFEPALQHYPRAFRFGDPAFRAADLAHRWHAARRRAMDRVLDVIAQSSWANDLVLRGSLLLRAWLGYAAREPGDLDFVLTPKSRRPTDPWAEELFAGLVSLVAERRRAGTVEILVGDVAADDIWTYDRAPGRRMVFPWWQEGLPSGVVQLDFVFGEELPSEPVTTGVPRADGGTTTVRAASKQQSLAWKLLWLETDRHPQGKDLYDATLLADQVWLPPDLLERTFRCAGAALPSDLSFDFPLYWQVDWDNFQLEYPNVPGIAREWQIRLAEALKPTFC